MVFCGIKNQKLLFKVCSFLNFRMWFKYGLKQHALKGQKLIAQGIALGIIAISKGDRFASVITQGDALG